MPTHVKYPDDSANTGPKKRWHERNVAGEVLHEDYVLIQDPTSDLQARVRVADPVGTEAGVVVRNIPSGTQPVSGPFLTDAEIRASPLPVAIDEGVVAALGTAGVPSVDVMTIQGILDMTPVQVSQAAASSAALANVASSATNVTIRAANTARRGLIVFNDSTEVLFIKFGATASSSSFTYKILAGGTYEMSQPIYNGIVDGIWASANGNARVTELT